jgi:hypothetical protein
MLETKGKKKIKAWDPNIKVGVQELSKSEAGLRNRLGGSD